MEARHFVLANRIVGTPKASDFKMISEILPTGGVSDGEIVTRAEYVSVDPYQRGVFDHVIELVETLPGGQVAKVIKSRNAEFPEDSYVVAYLGWRDITIYNPVEDGPRTWRTIYKLPDLKGLPRSYALGCLGMPGNTAYFGVLEICHPKPGEILVVSSAGGAVGSIAGQIGKIKGAHVIGIAGSDEKLAWMKDELGFDFVINYKTQNVDEALKRDAPKGIDCYFDNVGGEFDTVIFKHMKKNGRIAWSGSTSQYNKAGNDEANIINPYDSKILKEKHIKFEGFSVNRWQLRWFDGINQIRDWILEGKIKVRETVTEGFENLPEAFIDLLEGRNIGKQVVKAFKSSD